MISKESIRSTNSPLVHQQRRQHWALLPFVAGVLLGLAVSTVLLIRPQTASITNNLYFKDGSFQQKQGKFADIDQLLEELHAQERGTHELSDELSMKHTLYYAVMFHGDTSMDSLSVIQNTWARNIETNNINFFAAADESLLNDIISVHSSELLEMDTLKYICAHKLNQSKWFFISYNDVYIKRHQLESFLTSVENAPDDLGYIGKPIRRDPIGRVCMPGPGSVLSQSILSELCPKLNECSNLKTEYVVGECIRKQLPLIQCVKDPKLSQLFLKFDEGKKGSIIDTRNRKLLDNSLTVFPVTDSKLMYSIHQLVITQILNSSQQIAQELKHSVDQMTDLLPQADLRLYSNRISTSELAMTGDDIIPWKLISSNLLMSCIESNPAIKIHSLWKQELKALNKESIEYINSREDETYTFKRNINVYWRLNALLGTEYVIDFEAKVSGTESDYNAPTTRFRASLLRQYNEPQVSPIIQYVDTSRHISIGLIVTGDVLQRFEHFMSCLEKILNTDQKFDVLVIHMQGTGIENSNDVSQIMSLYEKRYHEVNFKLIKSPQTVSRPHAISLLIQELRPNDLVFLADIDLEFDYEFIFRCRSLPIQKQQVYFPIAFTQADPQLASKINHKAAEDSITEHSGHWLVNSYGLTCLYAADILSIMQQEDSNGLPEEISVKEMYTKFVANGYSIIRGADKGLRRVYSNDRKCALNYYGEEGENCQSLPDSYERLYLKTQLSVLLLDHEGTHAHKKY